MRGRNEFRPRLDALEAKALTSSLTMTGPGSTVGNVAAAPVSTRVFPNGTFKGDYGRQDPNKLSKLPPVTTYHLSGDGTVRGLDTRATQAGIIGTITLSQNARGGSITGTLSLSSSKGKLTLELSHPQGGGNSLPDQFNFKIVDGKEAYKNFAGTGTVRLTLTPGISPFGNRGTFTLVLTSKP